MKRPITFIALTLTIISVDAYAGSCSSVTPTLALRSQGRHADRQKWVGQVGHIDLFEQQPWYGTWDVGIAYMRSFKSNKIAHCLFGSDIVASSDMDSDNDECNSCGGSFILVQGSSVANRAATAWLADYLYLPCAYSGSFSVKPQITNVMVDLDFYLGLDSITPGMYTRFYGPITWTKWQTNFQAHDPEILITSNCGIGFLTPSGTEHYLTSIVQYFSGETIPSVDNVVFEGLKYAKMPSCSQSKAGFADLRAELGWNFYQRENYHIGLNLQAAAPTGNRRYAEYVMQPVVGNGHHWELGMGAAGHYSWKCDNRDLSFGLYIDANITHLFKATERRTFDLQGKNNSRYMLAAQFTDRILQKGIGFQLGGKTTAGTGAPYTNTLSIFNNVYTPVANLTTCGVEVSIPVQADVVAMLNFSCRTLSIDLGYNLWIRSCETITPAMCNDPCNASLLSSAQQNTWGLKGDSRMFGFLAVGPFYPIGLSATQSNADIHQGTNAASVSSNCSALQNCGVDNDQFAVAGNGTSRVLYAPLSAGGIDANSDQIKTSIQPIFLESSDIAFVETRGLSNKFFAHISRTWNDRPDWKPYLGIGGSAEFGSSCGGCSDNDDDTTSCNTDSCSSCTRCSVSQWALWVKGGFTF